MKTKTRYRVEWIEVFDECGSHKYDDKIFIEKSKALEFLKSKTQDYGRMYKEEYSLEDHGEWYDWDVVGEPIFSEHL